MENSFVGQTVDDICKKRLTSEHYGRAMAIDGRIVGWVVFHHFHVLFLLIFLY